MTGKRTEQLGHNTLICLTAVAQRSQSTTNLSGQRSLVRRLRAPTYQRACDAIERRDFLAKLRDVYGLILLQIAGGFTGAYRT